MPDTDSVSFLDVQRAARRIRGIAHRTPVMTSQSFNREFGVNAFFKCENMQRGGAFKIRGAANFIRSIPEDDLERGVVAFSSGNHAQAVAMAAKIAGTPATLVMPDDAPRAKMEATRAQGPTIVTYDRFQGSREAIARRIAAEQGSTLVPPFNHPWIVAGAGTTAMELLEEEPSLDGLVVCVGGGGLISGCAIAASAMRPGIRIFGVEPADGNDVQQSLAAGHPVEVAPPKTIADGLRTTAPGDLTFSIIQRHVEKIVTVTDDEIKAAVKFLLTRMKILVEPSGAVGAAAVMFGKLPAGLSNIGIVISGGNVDFETLAAF